NDLAKDSLDEWIYYLKNDVILDNFRAKGLPEAREILKVDALSKEERAAYYHHLDMMLLERNAISDSIDKGHFEGRAKGRAEGLVEGRAEGLVEGLAKGLAKGRAEGLAKGRADGLADGLAKGEAERKALESALEKEKAEREALEAEIKRLKDIF
ncbi:MAG: hypothetical protein LBC98_01230, partial [Prevotellaceae bacterium]|nr:hypothetical protein [Prevotellaceae bacterium]